MYTTKRIKRDRYKRMLVSKRVVPQLIHKVVFHDRSEKSTSSFGWGACRAHAHTFHHSLKNAVSTQTINRCIFSGRARGVSRFCKLSRIRIRELAGKGLLIGVSKASW